jgi:hypothetical protein
MPRTGWCHNTANVLCQRRGNRVPEAGPSRSEAEMTQLARSLSKMPDANLNVPGKTLLVQSKRDVATGVAHPHRDIVEYHSCKYGVPINRDVVFSMGAGSLNSMRYGKMSSEFGIPRGSTAWRARGPPMAVNEAGTGNSFPAPLVLSIKRRFQTLPAAGHCGTIASPS